MILALTASLMFSLGVLLGVGVNNALKWKRGTRTHTRELVRWLCNQLETPMPAKALPEQNLIDLCLDELPSGQRSECEKIMASYRTLVAQETRVNDSGEEEFRYTGELKRQLDELLGVILS